MTIWSKTRLGIYLLGIFIAGVVTGAIGHRWSMPPRPPRPDDKNSMVAHIENRLRVELKLTPDQVEKIHPVLVRNADYFNVLHGDIMRNFEDYLQKGDREIAGYLTPEQLPRFKTMQDERKSYVEKKLKGSSTNAPQAAPARPEPGTP